MIVWRTTSLKFVVVEPVRRRCAVCGRVFVQVLTKEWEESVRGAPYVSVVSGEDERAAKLNDQVRRAIERMTPLRKAAKCPHCGYPVPFNGTPGPALPCPDGDAPHPTRAIPNEAGGGVAGWLIGGGFLGLLVGGVAAWLTGWWFALPISLALGAAYGLRVRRTELRAEPTGTKNVIDDVGWADLTASAEHAVRELSHGTMRTLAEATTILFVSQRDLVGKPFRNREPGHAVFYLPLRNEAG